ncbi:INO80 complex subunit C [Macrosteles quadrilineatus]|uniref:INO80 complex subunit C n=1 Tax=Macrosteles quadrilineatus TaxID=74068 RepID=UPI0023E24123|nr:INO80 complex subunit C [Macrosteles quadrilineatus]XP_054268934.1 INO80 complex subunit C [Macrosteles quadrilineatus]XP_054268935.1 INO80 complex subunit C [Macrosteles quadrilineatus]XP_054268936.1 INO80 complex subunit C [Macrosteles quadrilineatus]
MAENIGLVIQVPSSQGTTSSIDISFEDIKEEKKFVFKDSKFQLNKLKKKKTYRTLKQIISQEKSLPWPPDAVTYSSIGAPPSFRPAKKYSDISGLSAKYTDPQTKLYYALAEEFSTVRNLPSDIIAGYLSLRGANNPIG